MTKPVKKRSKMTIARRVVVAAAFVACVVGVLAFGGAGSYCSFGADAIAAICPLGSLEALFGSWAVAPRALIALAVVVVLGVVFGKAFCSWACPVPPLDRFLRTKKSRRKDVDERHQAAAESLERWHACSSCGACSSHCASADGAQTADGENALA
ncbi:MAG: 4Fe-4S binding protein, partial [Senegalimassilia sp.]|uniref:4Fe-4S binding protein n=1 Tax=Senegalimassilia sp. TaxID=1922200 RepID=UPI00283CC1A9